MNAMKICRVCGKQYRACRNSARTGVNVFRWQEVACSPECGEKYLKKVLEDRAPSKTNKPAVVKTSVKKASASKNAEVTAKDKTKA